MFIVQAFGYTIKTASQEGGPDQLVSVSEYCRERGIELKNVFSDTELEIKKPFMKRPAAKQLIRKARQEHPDCLVVSEISILGKSTLDSISAVLRVFERPRSRRGLGIRVLSVKEDFMEPSNEHARNAALKVMDWVLTEERKRVRERQEQAWNEGKQKGRPKLITGEELISYVKKNPGLSMTALTKLLNSEREKRGERRVGYSTVRTLAKKSGIRWLLMMPDR